MKYFKFVLVSALTYILLYSITYFGYLYSDRQDFIGNVFSTVNKINSKVRIYIDIDKLFYINPRFIFPIKSDFLIDFSIKDRIYNDSVVKSVLNQGELFLDKDKKWRKTDIIINNRKIAAKYKFHGSSLYPYSRKHFSFSIKTNYKIRNINRFKLVNGIEMSYVNIFLNSLARENDLISEDPGEIVIVSVNGEKRDYFMYENFDEEYVNKNFELSNSLVVRNNTFIDKSRSWHESELDSVPINIDLEYISRDRFEIWKNLQHLKFEKIDFDKGYLGNFFSLLYLFGNPHQILGNNDKWIINNNRLIPVYRNEGAIRALDTESQNFNNSMFSNNNYESDTYIKYKKLLTDKVILQKRNLSLFKLLQNKEKILRKFDSIFLSNKEKHRMYNVDYFRLKIEYRKFKKIIEGNFNVIDKYLNYGHVMVSKKDSLLTIYSTRNNDLELIFEDKQLDIKSKEIQIIDNKLEPKLIINKVKIDPKRIRRGNFYFIDKVTRDTLKLNNEKFDLIEIL